MKTKKLYSIGEISQICNISKKTLRYYDEIGLLPSQRQDFNNYRCYSHDALLAIPVLKYYKQMGFKLNEIFDVINKDMSDSYTQLKECFSLKMTEIIQEQESLRKKNIAIQHWYKLMSEAESIIQNKINEISIKYVPALRLLYQEQVSRNQQKDDIINITWGNYVESIQNEITGPVFIKYHSIEERKDNKDTQHITILQESIMPAKETETVLFGEKLMLSCYHVGDHEGIPNEYERICAWAKKHKYVLAEESYERYVIDYWTGCDSSKFVTEILIEISRK